MALKLTTETKRSRPAVTSYREEYEQITRVTATDVQDEELAWQHIKEDIEDYEPSAVFVDFRFKSDEVRVRVFINDRLTVFKTHVQDSDVASALCRLELPDGVVFKFRGAYGIVCRRTLIPLGFGQEGRARAESASVAYSGADNKLSEIAAELWQYRCAEDEAHDQFTWPSTDVVDGVSDTAPGEWPAEGPLKAMGYKTGKSGKRQSERRKILDEVFRAKLPQINGPDYIAEWGGPSSTRRLQKMAESIASFARNAKRDRRNDKRVAIQHWEADLEYLNIKYYTDRSGFPWPTTSGGRK